MECKFPTKPIIHTWNLPTPFSPQHDLFAPINQHFHLPTPLFFRASNTLCFSFGNSDPKSKPTNPIDQNQQPNIVCMKSSPMAGWASNNPKLNTKGVDGNEMVFMGLEASQKPGMDFMQNCDLPPPVKVFTGSDKTVMSSVNRMLSMAGKEAENEEFNVYRRSGGESEKLELLKALRLSQTRAREAEKKATALVKERDCLSNALVEEATRLFAYRQWVRLLELHVSKLESQWLLQQHEHQKGCRCGGYGGAKGMMEGLLKGGDGGEDRAGVTWFMALAFCLGFVGVGFAFGYGYSF